MLINTEGRFERECSKNDSVAIETAEENVSTAEDINKAFVLLALPAPKTSSVRRSTA